MTSPARGRQPLSQRALLVVLVAVAAYVATLIFEAKPKDLTSSTIAEARERRLRDVIVETSGKVKRVLPDDTQPPRHQRIVIEVPAGFTVLLTHNIDVAERVPAIVGEEVVVKGEYVWNEKGGLIHWTHKTDRGEHPHGWIKHRNKTYD